MKSKETKVIQLPVYPFKNGNIVEVEGLSEMLNSFTKRITVSYSGSSTAKTYRNALRDLSLFHGCLVDQVETDEILDYLHYLREKELSWQKIKLDVAALKYFYREVCNNEGLASSIPYPKEEKSLPNILSRSELLRLFNAATNPKHRVILRLICGSGLRRAELVNLRISDIETDNGKYRIRINKSKGKKDRYTVLSKKVLEELRVYFVACKPKVYLFN
jgi:integrase/recombinase XerD